MDLPAPVSLVMVITPEFNRRDGRSEQSCGWKAALSTVTTLARRQTPGFPSTQFVAAYGSSHIPAGAIGARWLPRGEQHGITFGERYAVVTVDTGHRLAGAGDRDAGSPNRRRPHRAHGQRAERSVQAKALTVGARIGPPADSAYAVGAGGCHNHTIGPKP